MPIPDFNSAHLLPPFLENPAFPDNNSPYSATMLEVIDRFATTYERMVILDGLLSFRNGLRQRGITSGFFWLAGSFVEHIEHREFRPPGDVDVVCFLEATSCDRRELGQYCRYAKRELACHAFLVDLNASPRVLLAMASYWQGLFGHTKRHCQWKGLVLVDGLSEEDDEAAVELLAHRRDQQHAEEE